MKESYVKTYVALSGLADFVEAYKRVGSDYVKVKEKIYNLDENVREYGVRYEDFDDKNVYLLKTTWSPYDFTTSFKYLKISNEEYSFALNLLKLFYKNPHRFTKFIPNHKYNAQNLDKPHLAAVALLHKMGFSLSYGQAIVRNSLIEIEEYLHENE